MAKTPYGIVNATQDIVHEFPVGASEVFKRNGGGWVKEDSSGRIEMAGATSTNIIGHIEWRSDLTASSTEGADKVAVNLDVAGIVASMPISGTYAATMRGKTCDIIVTSSVQYANVAASSIDVLEIIGEHEKNSSGTVDSVLVKLFTANLTRTGVV